LRYAAFSGTSEGYAVLRGLSECGFEPDIVYTYPPKMRKTISNIHDHKGFNVFPVPKGFNVATDIRGRHLDAVLVVAWSRILDEDVLEAAPWVIGRHLASVPSRRGRAPVAWAIIDGLKHTEVSLMRLSAEMDAGPVVARRSVAISPRETSRSLLDKMNRISVDLFEGCLREIEAGGELPLVVQDEAAAGYTVKRTDEMGRIDWCLPAAKVDRLVRACGPPYWGAYTLNEKGEKVRVLKCVIDRTRLQSGCGVVWKKSRHGAHVSCGVGGVIIRPGDEFRLGERLR